MNVKNRHNTVFTTVTAVLYCGVKQSSKAVCTGFDNPLLKPFNCTLY